MGKETQQPAQPDYGALAQQQGAANVETARAQGRMNNPNVYTPYGSQQVYWGGAPPSVTQPAAGGTTTPTAPSTPMAAWGSPESITALNNAGLTSQFNPTAGSSQWFDTAAGQFLDDTQARQRYDSLGSPSSAAGTTLPSGAQGVSGGSDQPTIVQTLAPAQQELLDAQNRISGNLADVAESGLNRVSESMAQPFDTTNVRPLQADAAARQQAQDAAYRQQTSRLDPQFAQQEDQLRTRLMNQGLVPGGEAYKNAMQDFNFGRNDAYSSAFNNSFNTGLAAQQSDFGMQNQANTQNLQQQAYLRSLPLNELNALRTGAQVQNPQFQPYQGSQIGQTPVFQAGMAQAQGAQNAYNAQTANNNAMMSGLFSLGGAALGAPTGTFGWMR